MRRLLLLAATAMTTAARGADPLPPLDALDLAPARIDAVPAKHAAAARDPLAPIRESTANQEILEAIQAMPHGGGYASTGRATAALGEAIAIDPTGHLQLRPELAQPAFCSGATYLVFLSALERLSRAGRLHLTPDVLEALQMRKQADGTGLWGRWNANGPGTARLFHELALGRNFTSFEEAQPGDFLKIWWNDEVGARERGHSVVYRGSSVKDGQPMVTFWSANLPEGFSEKTVPKAKIHRALFSRLQTPEAIEHAPTLPARDAYLADMLRRGSSDEELARMVGLPAGDAGRLKSAAPAATPAPATPVPKKAGSRPAKDPAQ